MPIDAVFLLVANSVQLNKLTNRHLIYVELMQKVALVTSFAGISQPVDAHLLLSLLVTHLVLVG